MLDKSDVLGRPIAYPGFPNNEVAWQWPEAVTIETVIAVVSQHKIFVLFELPCAVTTCAAKIGNVRLLNHGAVDINTAFFDLDCFTRQPDYPLNEVLCDVFRVVQDNDIATL